MAAADTSIVREILDTFAYSGIYSSGLFGSAAADSLAVQVSRRVGM